MLTGQFPRSFGAVDNMESVPPSVKLDNLGLWAQEHDLSSAAFLSCVHLHPDYLGIGGFDFVSAPEDDPDYRSGRKVIQPERKAEDTTTRVVAWLEKNYKEDYFLWVHYFDPHYQYLAPIPFIKKFIRGKAPRAADGRYRVVQERPCNPDEVDFLTAQYDAEINYMDHWIGVLYRRLEELYGQKMPLIIITADHGETLGELQQRHQYGFGHGLFLYEWEVRVPLIIRWDGHIPPNRVYSPPVQITDIFPTVTDLLGNEPEPPKVAGISLKRYLINNEPINDHPPIVVQRFTSERPFEKRYLKGIYTALVEPPFKYIESPNLKTYELYHLPDDAAEVKNLVESRPDMVQSMSGRLKEWYKKYPFLVAPSQPIDKRKLEALKALGYVQ
jgi:arylsulfatase A-like enzyme